MKKAPAFPEHLSFKHRLGSVGGLISMLIAKGIKPVEARAFAKTTRRVRLSKHKPHQNVRECSRRLAQREKGMLFF